MNLLALAPLSNLLGLLFLAAMIVLTINLSGNRTK